MRRWILPLILLLVGESCFGATFAITRLAMDEGIPFIAFTFWSSFGAVIILFPVIALKGKIPQLSLQHLYFYTVSGVFGLALPYALLAVIAPHIPPATLSLVITIAPIITYLMAIILKMDRFYWVRAGGIISGIGGVLCVLLPKSSLPDAAAWIWMLIALLVPLCFAITAISAAKLRPSSSGSYDSAFALLAVATIVMVPIMFLTDQLWIFSGPMTDGDWALILYMIINAGFYIILYEVIRLAGPVFWSSGNFIATLAGVGWAILIFGEIPNYWIWIALLLLCSGLFLVNKTNSLHVDSSITNRQ